jgi:hypothetical protein
VDYDELQKLIRNYSADEKKRKFLNLLIFAAIPTLLIWAFVICIALGRFDLAAAAVVFTCLGGLVGWRAKALPND